MSAANDTSVDQLLAKISDLVESNQALTESVVAMADAIAVQTEAIIQIVEMGSEDADDVEGAPGYLDSDGEL